MADSKISDLTAVTNLLGTDEFVLARSGATNKISATDLVAGVTAAMVQVSDSLLGANANNFDFTDIPGTYKHLWLLLYLRGTKSATSVQPRVTFNADTGTNYDVQKQYAAGSTPGSGGVASQAYIDLADASAASSDTGAVSAIEVLIPNYAGTTFHKTVTGKGFNPRAYSAGNEYVMNTGGLWKSTAAITRITITPDANQWALGSRATLYAMQ